MAVSATSAAVSSFAGLRGLAIVAGWPVMLAPLLPLTIDAYAMTATRVWLAGSTRSARARRFARTNAVGAIGLSLAGNATYHLIAVRLVAASWVIVVAVGAVPALVLGLVSHLAVLRTQASDSAVVAPAEPEAGTGGSPAVPMSFGARPQDGPTPTQPVEVRTRYGTEDELLVAARAADDTFRASHGGQHITRDELRRTLRIGGARATAVLRQLKAQAATTA